MTMDRASMREKADGHRPFTFSGPIKSSIRPIVEAIEQCMVLPASTFPMRMVI